MCSNDSTPPALHAVGNKGAIFLKYVKENTQTNKKKTRLGHLGIFVVNVVVAGAAE